MFGMGFTEILFIAVIAILFLGPDKLPTAMVEIAKFFRNAKKTIGSVKDSFEEEMNVKEIKAEALAYKKELLSASDELKSNVNMGTSLSDLSDDMLGDDDDEEVVEPKKEKQASKAQKVTFEKKPKKENKPKKEDIDV